MCGIAGVLCRDDQMASAQAHALICAMSHRGPDGSGIVSINGGALGMVRLRVRSDPALKIPIQVSDGIAAYNGEVYRGTTDVGNSSPTGGPGEIEALLAMRAGGYADGMYSLAFAPHSAAPYASVELWRDPLGIKPLFTLQTETQIGFASELSALIKVFGASKPNSDALVDIFAFGRALDDATAFSSYKRVPPGQRLTLNQRTIERSTKIDFPASHHTASPGSLLEALQDSVGMCLQSDRSIGLAVSGGLDSSLIAALIDRFGYSDFRTVSLQISGTRDGVGDLSELEISKNVSRNWSHVTEVFQSCDLSPSIRDGVMMLAEPFRMTSVPLYTRLAKLASRHGITVLITGEGADELFLGYESYHTFFSDMDAPGRNLRLALSRFACPQIWREWTERLFGRNALQSSFDRFHTVIADFETLAPHDALRRLELLLSLEPLLQRADHALMAEGIEGRVPFLHGAVPAIANSARREQLIDGSSGKLLLRESAAALIPNHQALKTKIPFRAPVMDWLTGPLSNWAAGRLLHARERLQVIGINPDAITSLSRGLEEGHRNLAPIAFTLLTFVEWNDLFVSNCNSHYN